MKILYFQTDTNKENNILPFNSSCEEYPDKLSFNQMDQIVAEVNTHINSVNRCYFIVLSSELKTISGIEKVSTYVGKIIKNASIRQLPNSFLKVDVVCTLTFILT